MFFKNLILCTLFAVSSIFYCSLNASNGHNSEIPELGNWPASGLNELRNDHDNSKGTLITKQTAASLVEMCGAKFSNTDAAHTATPILVEDVVYWVGSGGEVGASKLPLFADENGVTEDCEDLWRVNVQSIVQIPNNPQGDPPVFFIGTPDVRVSPAFYYDSEGKPSLLYVGIRNHFSLAPFLFTDPRTLLNEREIMFAVSLDAETGVKKWIIPLTEIGNPDDFAISSLSSPSIHNGVAYFGLSSLNNVFNGFVFPPFTDIPGVPSDLNKLKHRGQMIAVDLNEQEIKWKQFTIPEKPEGYDESTDGPWFSGAGVWTSGTSFLPNEGKKGEGLVFFGSGQLYSYPNFVAECMLEEFNTPFVIEGTEREIRLKGETGKGSAKCHKKAVKHLKKVYGIGAQTPLANNSIIALNVYDGSFAWYQPTAGIDAWQSSCGIDSNNPNFPCTVPVPGGDWDVGGSAPVIVNLPAGKGHHDKKTGNSRLISANKGGMLFILNPKKGNVISKIDLCPGSPLGGIHWGVTYDRKTGTILASCSGGLLLEEVDETQGSYQQTLADGTKICNTGVLNAIDLKTKKLKWQSVPNRAVTPAEDPECESIGLNDADERFKFGLNFNKVIKNKVNNSVNVNYMPDDGGRTPITVNGFAHSHGLPAIANGVVYWPIYNGTLYALDIDDGSYIHQLHCRKGAMYGGPSIARNRLAIGCGEPFQANVPNQLGQYVEIFSLPDLN